VNDLRGLFLKPRDEPGVVVAENGAELPGGQVQYPLFIGVDEKAAFAPHDNGVHEGLNEEEMRTRFAPNPKIIRAVGVLHLFARGEAVGR